MFNWLHAMHVWYTKTFYVVTDDSSYGLIFKVRLCSKPFCGKTTVDVLDNLYIAFYDTPVISREGVPAKIAEYHRKNVARKEKELEEKEYAKHWNNFKLPNAMRQPYCTECGRKED